MEAKIQITSGKCSPLSKIGRKDPLECVHTATEVQLRIRDSGVGMPAAQVPRIFEPLYTTKPGGTGLGLYIVQEILVAHGGRVTVDSVEGQGTTFVLTFPAPG